MKRLILFTFTLLTAVVSMAQPQSFGLHLGYANPVLREPDLTSVNLSYSSKLNQPTQLRGLQFGAVYEGTIVKGFGAFFALDYTFGMNNTGWNSKFQNMKDPRVNTRTQYHSLSLRSDWQYKFEVAKQTHLLLYTGPVIDVNLAMKANYREKAFDLMKREDVLLQDINYNLLSEQKAESPYYGRNLMRYNILWGVGAGFQYDRYFVRGGYDFGIVDTYKAKTYKNASGEHKFRNRMDNWHISVGVYLWRSDD